MASANQVKHYLAQWFQLGKRVVLAKTQEKLLPQNIIQGDRYSSEFENCWQRILDIQGQDCYLEGTNETIEELLSNKWEIVDCVRCNMPVPIIQLGIQSNCCPCFDLPTWPNTEIPAPRSPVDSVLHLSRLRQRLGKNSEQN